MILTEEFDPTGGLDLAKVPARLATEATESTEKAQISTSSENSVPSVAGYPMLGTVLAAKLYGGLEVETELDPQVQPFLLTVARTAEDELPDIRVIALNAFSMLANAAEAQQARALIEREPGPEDGGFKTTFTTQNDKALTAAAECNEDLQCWIRKLSDRDKEIRSKAAYMIARYGRGNPAAITALVAKLDDNEETVRGDVLYALDFVADHGSPEAVQKIMDMKAHEEGRAIWAHVKPLALPTAGRLRLRAAH